MEVAMAGPRDLEKRRRVMQRSMQLGHCICDPRKPCPCDVFRDDGICPCAGEEYAAPAGPVRLTELAESAGCASKIDQATLQRILEGLPSPADPRVLVGMPAGDDAGVYLLDERTALVQTVDVFSPPVDDPYLFGQIAAANSLSDVYAMGGRPITARLAWWGSRRASCPRKSSGRFSAAGWTRWPRPAWPSSAATASRTARSRRVSP